MEHASAALPHQPRRLFGLSAWLVIGISVILGLTIISLAVRGAEREKEHMSQTLLGRAGALIWALEAGTRTWLGYQGDRDVLQLLVEETARQPDILYLAVVGFDGTIIAHSNDAMVGTSLPRESIPAKEDADVLRWRVADTADSPAFEVYRVFAPVRERPMGMMHGRGRGRGRGGHHGMRMSSPPPDAAAYDDNFVIVGMEQSTFQAALTRDFQNTLVSALAVAALGLGGCISLFWAHNYRRSNDMLHNQMQRNERLAALGNLAAGVAHEIRNPLSSIKGFATFIARKLPEEAPEAAAAKTMIVEVNRLNAVVSELLEFARPGTVDPGAKADMNGVIDRALRLADADIRENNVAVVFQPDASLPRARGNAERLTQALLNLFLNAVQAMPRGGVIRIDAHPRPDSENLDIVVEDTGQGMTEEVRKSIFDPYFTTKPTGTGLGLAIVHQIVESHSGSVSVRSRQGVGTAFTVTIPAAQS